MKRQSAIYYALDTQGGWARSEFPDELITIDYNKCGKVIGVEAVGSAADEAIAAVIDALPDVVGWHIGRER